MTDWSAWHNYLIRCSCCDVSELAQLVCLNLLETCTTHNTATLGFYVLILGPHRANCLQISPPHTQYLHEKLRWPIITDSFKPRCESTILPGGGASEAKKILMLESGVTQAKQAMLKCSFSHILETLFLSFLTASLPPKTDKNSALHCTSINLRYFYVITFAFVLTLKEMKQKSNWHLSIYLLP